MHYVGTPVGLNVFTVAAAAHAEFSAYVEVDLLVSRLRWNVPTSGLVLLDAWIGLDSLIAAMPTGPALALAGEGLWRFVPTVARAGWRMRIMVENKWGGPITPHTVAFWGRAL
ncbi:MAG TPA: hypothetical protein VJN18_11175 [Polyangiaceae bacterium]|nr:hypothetical protein [Polyangiaceae bacterium]